MAEKVTEVKSVQKFARISDQKAREITRAITGMSVSHAINILNFTPRKAAYMVGKVLRTAVANAENTYELDADDLMVKSATATKGPILHRMMPRARGSSAGIKKRMAHITVILGPKPEEKAVEKKTRPVRRKPAKKSAE